MRRRERMVDEGLAALTDLSPVRGVGRVVGVGDQLFRSLGPVRRYLLDKRRDVHARRRNGPGTLLCSDGFHTQIIPARRFTPCQHFSTPANHLPVSTWIKSPF